MTSLQSFRLEPRTTFALDGARALIVSHDACLRWKLCGWLSRLGASVRQVGALADALDTLSDLTHFDIVVVSLECTDVRFFVGTMRAMGVATPCLLLQQSRAAPRLDIAGAISIRTPMTVDELAAEAERTLAAR